MLGLFTFVLFYAFFHIERLQEHPSLIMITIKYNNNHLFELLHINTVGAVCFFACFVPEEETSLTDEEHELR